MGNLHSSEGVHLRFLDGCPEIPPAPAEDQVQILFDELLLSTCADQELREEINTAESIETKWAYAFMSKLPHGSVAEEWLDPRDCVELVQRFRGDVKCVHDLFLAIRINMLLRPSVWVEKFVSENGIEQLMAPLQGRTAPPVEAPMKVKDDPQYAKFFKLLSMGAPPESVKAKMRMANLQPELLDTPDAPLQPVSSPSEVVSSQPEVKVKDDPAYAKFFKLLSMGAPAESVKAKMRMTGLNPDLLDAPDASLPSVNAPAAATKSAVKVKDDPGYAKFFKLLSMGAPAESVKAKMQMAGLRPELLDTPDADLRSGDTQAPAQPQVKVKDDPAYAKFFKLLEMGAPAESVKAKMRMAGLQGDLLDTPDALLPGSAPVNPPATPAPTSTAARRAHLSIAIKPVIKAKTRAFYWQHLKAEAIKGTIWEELEKEHSNQCNQDWLTLTESELELLETEFPPPAACGPSTGSRRGSMSGIGSPGGPASPLASPRIVFLIDRARSNNISIIVKQFKMSNAALRVAIMKMDSEVLTLDRVQGLIKILPTEEEIAAITGFTGDPTTLNGAELVLKELITVPRLKQRLSALETKHQFPALVRDLQTKINKIRVASNEIAQSSEFKTILTVILQVGNKMNHGTARGGAKGFRLNDLTKLVQLKSVDKSVTLLHYVARMIRTKKGNVVRLGDSLASLYDVQSIPIPELLGDMNRINDITENINVELAAQRLKNRIEEKEESDLFVESMTVFVDEAAKDVSTLKTDLDENLRLMRDIMIRFDKSTDDEEAPPQAADAPPTPAALAGAGEFFSIIYEFTMSLMKADRENEIKRIREEKRLKQQELKNATPRRNSVDQAALKKLDSAAGPDMEDSPRRKSMIAVPSNASFKTDGVSSLLAGASSKPISVNVDDAGKAEAKPESSTTPGTANSLKNQEIDVEKLKLESASVSKPTNVAPAAVVHADETQPSRTPNFILSTDEKVLFKPTGIPKPALKVPGKVMTANFAPPPERAGARRRLATDALSSFRAIDKKGLRGFLEGGVFTLSTPLALKEGMNDSTLIVSNEYRIFPSKYVYLVPYFNGEYHGHVARIELDLKGKKRPRPARFLEFSDYETPNGIGPYDDQCTLIFAVSAELSQLPTSPTSYLTCA
ncbi:formin-homology 2 domain-containing protein [Phytophthora cinnamomi]|uniref:formin-homology 2 domain-containing protein n=1 Tax=Phytophthora cinnamomi TaxID=4785 RepID=UPI0035594899|nr:formin-homology 2 domain-containing protein [Phytophthora cinnamomi]